MYAIEKPTKNFSTVAIKNSKIKRKVLPTRYCVENHSKPMGMKQRMRHRIGSSCFLTS